MITTERDYRRSLFEEVLTHLKQARVALDHKQYSHQAISSGVWTHAALGAMYSASIEYYFPSLLPKLFYETLTKTDDMSLRFERQWLVRYHPDPSLLTWNLFQTWRDDEAQFDVVELNLWRLLNSLIEFMETARKQIRVLS